MANIPIRSILSQDFGSYKGFLAENYAAQELQSGVSAGPERISGSHYNLPLYKVAAVLSDYRF